MARRDELLPRGRSMSPFGQRGLALLTTFVAGLFVLAGCGKGAPPFQEVSGRVTFQKQPLRKGLIEFVPTASGGSSAGAIIRDGQYLLRPEAGLLPGSYRVKVVPTVPVRADWEERPRGGTGKASKIVIPAKYNVDTVLTAEVKTDGKQTIDFELD
jgi:hypothetical protein